MTANPGVDLSMLCVLPTGTLRDAITCIDSNQRGIALVVDQDRRLLGTVTDGDIRRAMLAGRNLEFPIIDILARKAETSPYPRPVTAPVGTDSAVLLEMMHTMVIRQIPLLDESGRVGGLVTMSDLLPEQMLPLEAVIMAGGRGTRLLPLTEHTPKPMLPLGGKPIMELIINQLREAGIHRVNVTTHYESEKIRSHFGDGQNFGVDLKYVEEERPLGTAGALGLMAVPTAPLLVINGDILTQVDFRAMLEFHREHRADLTLGVRRYDIQVPYGVVECEDMLVRNLTEKPSLSFFVNAGIYLLEPSVHKHIPNGQSFNMTDLIQRLLEEGCPVVSFPIREYWLDIGRLSDYELAQEYVKGGELR
jgi:dTDP-glucose pyrophosphorylase/CBS domain-containing protein